MRLARDAAHPAGVRVIAILRRGIARLLLAGVAACLALPAQAQPAKPKILIGVGIDATYGEVFVAIEKGFFAKQGIDAEYKTFEAGGMSIAAAAGGTVQVGAGGELPGLKPVSDGARIVYVATGVYTGKSGGTGVVAGIKSPADLAGKKVAVLKGSTSELYQTLFFRKHGLDGKAEVVNVAVPEMIPAMARGDVQAIFVWEPWLTRMTENVPNSSVPWRYSTDGVYELHWGYWFNKDFIEKTPERRGQDAPRLDRGGGLDQRAQGRSGGDHRQAHAHPEGRDPEADGRPPLRG